MALKDCKINNEGQIVCEIDEKSLPFDRESTKQLRKANLLEPKENIPKGSRPDSKVKIV